MWDLPRPGIEPVSPASAGGFFPTEPPGKPEICFFLNFKCIDSLYLLDTILHTLCELAHPNIQ